METLCVIFGILCVFLICILCYQYNSLKLLRESNKDLDWDLQEYIAGKRDDARTICKLKNRVSELERILKNYYEDAKSTESKDVQE